MSIWSHLEDRRKLASWARVDAEGCLSLSMDLQPDCASGDVPVSIERTLYSVSADIRCKSVAVAVDRGCCRGQATCSVLVVENA